MGVSNWEKMLSVAFFGYHSQVMGECHHGGVGMVMRETVSEGTGTQWYHNHIIRNNK